MAPQAKTVALAAADRLISGHLLTVGGIPPVGGEKKMSSQEE
jgi:hypothetical protein